jgi:hypothetical protein
VRKGLVLAGVASAFLGSIVATGCGGSSGHGGYGTTIGGVTSQTPTKTGTGLPVVTITQPARGAFLPAGPVTVAGTVTAPQGLSSLTVQGAAVTVGASGNFSTSVTLPDGVQRIKITATDKTGNRTDRSISVETGNYLPTTQVVPDALAGRINLSLFPIIQRIAATEIANLTSGIGASLVAQNPVASVAGVDIDVVSLAFGTPTVVVGINASGIIVDMSIPQLAIEAQAKGSLIPFTATAHVSADAVNVQATLALGALSNGQLDVQFPTVNVTFQNFQLALPGWLQWAGPLIDPLLSNFLGGEVASLLRTQGAAAIKKYVDDSASLSLSGTPANFSYAIDGIQTDANGLAFDTGANMMLFPDPTYPAPPGSLSSPGGLPTSFSTTNTVVFSISRGFINRFLEQAWQSGMLATVVNPNQVAQQFGAALPIPASAQDLVNFFPQLQGVVPTQYLQAPVLYRIKSLLPPTVTLMPGVPDPLQLHFGEYEVTASIDTGGQPLDVFTVSMHAEIQLGVQIANGTIKPLMTSLPNPIVDTDLISSPLAPLGAAHVESYLDVIIPNLFAGIVTQLPPIPVPQLPAGVQLIGASFAADGPTFNYLTISADLK